MSIFLKSLIKTRFIMSALLVGIVLSHLQSLLPQSCTRGECIWSDQAGAEMVLVWFLQEAQGKIYFHYCTGWLVVAIILDT